MILDPTRINVDIKVQDRFRQYLSELLSKNLIELKCVMLGDSDIDYEMGYQINKVRILNSPYNIQAIKYPLIYNGLGKGIKGTVTTFVRYVDTNGTVSSYYNYPTDTVLSSGRVPPILRNGYDVSFVEFTSAKSGAIVFLQSLLDYYVDENGVQQRLKEQYDIKFFFNGSQVVPNGWQATVDSDNGSFLIGKSNVAIQFPSDYKGEVLIKGLSSQLTKTLKFKF